MTDLNAPADDTADVLVRTLYGEARGQSEACMRAIASVVLNRVRVGQACGGKHWWGADVRSVCRAPGQFRSLNPGNPDRPDSPDQGAFYPPARPRRRVGDSR